MSDHVAIVRWVCRGDFAAGAYSREHTWEFDGGVEIPASPSPAAVRPPLSNPANVDPEEAFVAAISSCHMLTFLYEAQRAGFEVQAYEDRAVGRMSKNAERRAWVSSVTLRPRIRYAPGAAPNAEQERTLHEAAHAGCFIANSVKSEIMVLPADAGA